MGRISSWMLLILMVCSQIAHAESKLKVGPDKRRVSSTPEIPREAVAVPKVYTRGFVAMIKNSVLSFNESKEKDGECNMFAPFDSDHLVVWVEPAFENTAISIPIVGDEFNYFSYTTRQHQSDLIHVYLQSEGPAYDLDDLGSENPVGMITYTTQMVFDNEHLRYIEIHEVPNEILKKKFWYYNYERRLITCDMINKSAVAQTFYNSADSRVATN